MSGPAFRITTIATAIVVAMAIMAIQFGLLAGRPPQNLGVTNGRLAAPSQTPNSVSSQATLYPAHPQQAYSAIAPLTFSGDGAAAMARLALVIRASERAVLVTEKSDYLLARFSSPVLKFTDDAEFWLDASAGVIHVRSASRLGRSDFGVNRARIENIRARFTP